MPVEIESSILYVTGIRRNASEHEIAMHFSSSGEVTKVVFPVNPDTQVRRGYALVYYTNSKDASHAVQTLHYSFFKGKALSVRLEISIDKESERISNRAKFAVTRKIENQNKEEIINYTSKSLKLSNGSEYPIPTGLYLMQLLRKFHSAQLPFKHQILFDILVATKNANHQGKELTECMAMVNAVIRSGHISGIDIESEKNVNIYAIADGIAPYTASALGIFMPESWQYWTIDPLLDFSEDNLVEYKDRIHLIKMKTEEFTVPDKTLTNPAVSVVIACHSHAPLQEFWDRVPPPKLGIIMPCCGKSWSSLNLEPIDVYDDFEVQSPKRKIFIYYQK